MVYNSVGYHSVCYIFLFTISSALYKTEQQNVPRGKLIVSVILNNVNSSFASLDFACLELLLLISTGFHYTFTIW